jgi:hypothetical protein
MRFLGRVVATLAAVGVIAPPVALAGLIPVAISAGLPGGTAPTATGEFQFQAPAGGVVAVNQLAVGDTVSAVTGGGEVFFGGAGVPVLLNLSDGGAALASSNAPAGLSPPSLASLVPQAGAAVPPSAALLGVSLAGPGADGSRVLRVNVTTGSGADLGGGQVAVPSGGWWVLGLGPADASVPPPVVDPVPVPPVVDPVPVTDRPPDVEPPKTPTGAVMTPEPSTLVAAVLGTAAIGLWRRPGRPTRPATRSRPAG